MNHLRAELKPRGTSHASYATYSGPVLPDERIDRLLKQPPKVHESPTAPPMHGIWFGVALGMVLWCVIVGIVLAARLL